MFSVWQGDIRIVHRLHRYDAETLVRVVEGARIEARRLAVEECALKIDASRESIIAEWGTSGLILSGYRSKLAEKIRALMKNVT